MDLHSRDFFLVYMGTQQECRSKNVYELPTSLPNPFEPPEREWLKHILRKFFMWRMTKMSKIAVQWQWLAANLNNLKCFMYLNMFALNGQS